jgi:hypothetical protein
MCNYTIGISNIHTQPQVQGSVIVMHDELCTAQEGEWLKKCKEEGEFLGSVLFHTLPQDTLFYMSAMIRRLEEM